MNKQVEQIKAEVERLWRMCMNDDDYIDAVALDVLSKLKDYIHSLQEEPISEDLEEAEEPSIPEIVDEHYWEMLGEEPVNELDKLRALSDGKPHLGWLVDAQEVEEFEEQVKKLWNEVNTGHSYSLIDSYNIFYGLCLDIVDWYKEKIEKQYKSAMQYVKEHHLPSEVSDFQAAMNIAVAKAHNAGYTEGYKAGKEECLEPFNKGF